GITMPAIVLNYFGQLETGLILSLGAMAVSVYDIPGPIHQRRNGMLATIGLIFLVSLITSFINHDRYLSGLGIAVLCFVLSFVGAYGARVNAIGFAGILTMVLTLDYQLEGSHILYHRLYLAAGGGWYMLLSLALF